MSHTGARDPVAAVELRDLTVVFPSPAGDVRALDRLSLSVPTGRVFGFVGPNGAGKTTAMHVLLGFVRPTSGEARVFGVDVGLSLARQRIGYLPEHPDTYRFLTGRELLAMAARLFAIPSREVPQRIARVVELTGIADAADRRTATYSRGMLQRIGLAQALINDPDLVILDEPTGGLDPFGRLAVRRVISRLREEGKTVFFSSHELSEVELVCDHLAIIARGRLLAAGATRELVPAGVSLERYFMQVVESAQGAPGPAQGAARETP